MSGGKFDYKQYEIDYIIDEIKQIIRNNNISDKYGYKYNYSEETLEKFKEGIDILNKAAVYAQRIDWLVSGDDSEEAFHERLIEDLNELK
jgi:hypothetical protein